MCEGEARGDFDLRTMLADSNLWNSALAIYIFMDGDRGVFQKQGGGYQCGCDAQPHGKV
jgi:hypothetical protein